RRHRSGGGSAGARADRRLRRDRSVLAFAPDGMLSRGDHVANIPAFVVGIGSRFLSVVTLRLATRAAAADDADAALARAACQLADVVRRQWEGGGRRRLVLS